MPKKVKPGAKPRAEKQIKFVERPNLYQLPPKWSFVKCDMQHEKWGIFNNDVSIRLLPGEYGAPEPETADANSNLVRDGFHKESSNIQYQGFEGKILGTQF